MKCKSYVQMWLLAVLYVAIDNLVSISGSQTLISNLIYDMKLQVSTIKKQFLTHNDIFDNNNFDFKTLKKTQNK